MTVLHWIRAQVSRIVFVVVWHMSILSIYVGVTSMTLCQTCDGHSCKPSKVYSIATAKSEPYPYRMGFTTLSCQSNIRVMVLTIQYIPRNMHTVFALLCFVVVIHWLLFPYPSGLLHWHCGNLTIAPVPAKQPWWIWINTSCEFIMNDCITTTKQSTTKPCAYFLGYTVRVMVLTIHISEQSCQLILWAPLEYMPKFRLSPV